MNALELVRQEAPTAPLDLVDPETGEQVALADASPQLIATVLGLVKLQADEMKERCQQVTKWLGDEIITRMDDDAEWTVSSRGVKVSAPSPAAGVTTWDAEALHLVLQDLVKAEVITEAAALRACKINVEYVPQVGGIKALLKNPKAAPAILTAQRTGEPPKRRVTVKPVAGDL